MDDGELHILHIKDILGGGVASVMLNYANELKNNICFDWLLTSDSDSYERYRDSYEDKFTNLGGKIIYEGDKTRNFLKRGIWFYKLLKKDNYKIIHVHCGSPKKWKILFIAKLAGVKCRIIHSHGSGFEKREQYYKSQLRYRIDIFLTRLFATDYFACSKNAGRFVFGEKGVCSKKFHIIYNAILVEKFHFDKHKRDSIRNTMKLNDTMKVIGYVGRLTEVKNLHFLIEVFYYYNLKNHNSELWLVGDGELKKALKKEVEDYNLHYKVKFWGNREDVNDLMCAMDMLLLTSFNEGLGMVTVEGQVSGLPCLVSDSIPEEAKISNRIEYLSLLIGASKWAEYICEIFGYFNNESREQARINVGLYDIKTSSKNLKELYLEMFKRF